MARQYLVDKGYLTELIREYFQGPWNVVGFTPVTIKATHNLMDLWEVRSKVLRAEIVNLAKDIGLAKRVNSCLDRTGFTELSITDIMSKKQIRTSNENWQQHFLEMVTHKDGYKVELFPDTNFIKRRYPSNLLTRLGKETFSKLNFGLPRLVILEIEARYNRAKKKMEKESCPAQEKTRALTEIREELMATQELIFLREHQAQTLDMVIEGVIPIFSKVAGEGFADAYIRSEILDGTRMYASFEPRFLTCDSINALSAVAEGLPTLYFSRVPLGVLSFSGNHFEQIADLIFDTTVAFGEITLTTTSSGKSETKLLKCDWDGWNIEDFLKSRIIEESEE